VTAAAKKILEEALSLPNEERRRVAEALLDSIPSETADEIEAAWVAEARRRADESERGRVDAVDGDAALRELKARFLPAAR
jgi:putative addiction module component (TIGR02574 family)